VFVALDVALGEQPLELRARKVGIENEAGGAADQIEVAIGLELFTAGGGSAVLPDDRLMARHAGSLVPQHDGLALIGDADRSDGLIE
jgi:hypothetical protein